MPSRSSHSSSSVMSNTKKKMFYESKGSVSGGGFVRRLAGGIFSSSSSAPSSRSLVSSVGGGVDYNGSSGMTNTATESRWRPRKKEFERLDEGDEDSFLHEFHHGSDNNADGTALLKPTRAMPKPTTSSSTTTDSASNIDHWTIKNVFSTESDAREYKREIMYEKKRKTIRKHVEASKTQKHDWSSFSIKPSKRDGGMSAAHVMDSATKKRQPSIAGSGTARAKEEVDPFTSLALKSSESHVDQFGFQQHPGQNDDDDHDDDEELSRYTSSTKHTFQHTVTSDPTDFFSKEATVKLTRNNLARMDEVVPEPKGGKKITNHTNNTNTFYQFALDNDRESTVVESAVENHVSNSQDEEGDDYYSDEDSDDMTEASEGVASTLIQFNVPKPTMPEKKDELSFSSNQVQDASKADEEKEWFENFKSDYDNFANPARPDPTRNQSTHSLAYSPSPVQQRVDRTRSESRLNSRDARFPLSPLNNFKSVGSNNGNTPSRQRTSPLVPSNTQGNNSNSNSLHGKKPDPVEAWIGFNNNSKFGPRNAASHRPDPAQSFDPFFDSNQDLNNDSFKNDKKKRDPSISQIVDARFNEKSNENESLDQFAAFHNADFSTKTAHGAMNKTAVSKPTRQNDSDTSESGSRKENSSSRMNQQSRNVVSSSSAFRKIPVTAAPSSDLVPKYRQPLFRGDSEDYEDEQSVVDDDSFDSDAPWKHSGAPMGIKNFPSSNRMASKKFSDDVDEYDRHENKSISSKRSSNAGGSFTKPLGLPSNAIMASMLFQKHYNIDQTAVEQKLKAKEEEHSKERKGRNGDVPDSVHADQDYMTTVSSFSDATPTAFSDAWKKPSRDILNYYSSSRTLDMDSKTYLAQSQSLRVSNNNALYEA